MAMRGWSAAVAAAVWATIAAGDGSLADCPKGFVAVQERRTEVDDTAKSMAACAAVCSVKQCGSFEFREGDGCLLHLEGKAHRCSKIGTIESDPVVKQAKDIGTIRSSWQPKEKPNFLGKCHTGGEYVTDMGWAKELKPMSLESCQKQCEDDDDCVAISHFPLGARVIDKLWIDSSPKTEEYTIAFIGATQTTKRIPHCETGPTDAMSEMANTSLRGRCLQEEIPRDACTLCYRVVTECAKYGDAADCTVLNVEAAEGGVYLRPGKRCPTLAVPAPLEKPQARCPAEFAGRPFTPTARANKCQDPNLLAKTISSWIPGTASIGKTVCANSVAGECDDHHACGCRSDSKPCARAIMGAQIRESGDDPGEFMQCSFEVQECRGRGGCQMNSFAEQTEMCKHILRVSINGEGECVSERDFCKIAKNFLPPSKLLDATQWSLVLAASIAGEMNALTQEMADAMVDSLFSMADPVADLESTGMPGGIVIAKTFGMFMCYMEMIMSDDEHRGKEFTACEVEATLRLIIYAAVTSTVAGATLEAFMESPAVGGIKTVLASAKAGAQSISDVRHAVHIARNTSKMVGREIKGVPALDAAQVGIDKAASCADNLVEIMGKVEGLLSGTESLIVGLGSTLITEAVTNQIDMDGWASTQPYFERPSDSMKKEIGKHLNGLAEVLSTILMLLPGPMDSLMGGAAKDMLERKVEGFANFPIDREETAFCTSLGYNYRVDTQFRDAHFTECRVQRAAKEFLDLVEQPELSVVAASNPVCKASIRDFVCLRAIPPADSCKHLTSCKIVCRNINMCAENIGLKAPYDCPTECACMYGCFDEIKDQLSTATEKSRECIEHCVATVDPKDMSDPVFLAAMNSQILASSGNTLDWTKMPTSPVEVCVQKCRNQESKDQQAMCDKRGKKGKRVTVQQKWEGFLRPAEALAGPLPASAMPPKIAVWVGALSLMAAAGFRLVRHPVVPTHSRVEMEYLRGFAEPEAA